MGHAHHGQQGQLLPLSRGVAIAGIAVLLTTPGAHAQGPRAHTRPTPNTSTAVTESQATELTLTLTEVAVRPIQVWVRTAGTIDAAHKTITATLPPATGARVRVGQRARAFPPESRFSMYQAFVTQVARDNGGVRVGVTLAGPGREGSTHYVIEIVTDAGDYLSVPNEAIIETGGRSVVYVQEGPGRYTPQSIERGLQGELYTEVRKGVDKGQQVVTFGSFFIDADHKLKGS